MEGMGGYLIPHAFMALQAGLISRNIASQHVVGIAVVHGMTGQAGHLALRVTGGFQKSIVFTASHSNHPIRPEKVSQQIRPFLDNALQPWQLIDFGGLNHRSGRGKILSRPVIKARGAPLFFFVPPAHAVTLTAYLGGSFGIQSFRMHNGILPRRQWIPTRHSRVQRLLPLYMRLTRPVTGFAGDPQISSLRGYPISLRVMRGNPGGGMTANTGKVPDFGCCTRVGIPDERRLPRYPLFFFNQPGKRKTDLHIAVISRQPEYLHMMGTRHQTYAQGHPFGRLRWHCLRS